MNRSIAEKALLVMVLVTLMGAGAMSSADSSGNGSAENQGGTSAASIVSISSAGSAAGSRQANPHAVCLEERLATTQLSPMRPVGRSMRED
jgi:hypothetical protein